MEHFSLCISYVVSLYRTTNSFIGKFDGVNACDLILNEIHTFKFQPTHVNLNHMLCPAVLDPFEGPNYRIAAVIHQGILCPLLCKLVCLAFTPRGTVITGDNNGESVTESVLDSHNNKTNKVAQLIDLNKQRSQLLACDNSQLSDGTNVSCTEKSVVDGVQLSTEPDELLKTAPSSPLSSSGLSMTVANHHNNESGLNKKID